MISLTNLKKTDGHAKGFTLLELLIVIAIIAILSIALVFMLNPAETLKKARDAQRISDLKSVKTALGIMLTASSTPSLDGTFGATATGICATRGDGTAQVGKIAYSINSGTPPAFTAAAGGIDWAGSGNYTAGSSSATPGSVNGDGWIPVKLRALTGGTPIASFPVDPTNTASASAVAADLVYRYACQNATSAAGKPSFVFETDARLESNAYTVDDNKMANDGGDNATLYESGNSLYLLPTTATF